MLGIFKKKTPRSLMSSIDEYLAENLEAPEPDFAVCCQEPALDAAPAAAPAPCASAPRTSAPRASYSRQHTPLHAEDALDSAAEFARHASLFRMEEAAPAPDLTAMLAEMDESFSDSLMHLIDASGMRDSEVYKRAGLSRQHFSKIRSDVEYRPTKKTALALCVALGLDLDATEDLLGRAGYTLSHSSKADVIVEYFIVNGIFDLATIDQALYDYDQPLLAS